MLRRVRLTLAIVLFVAVLVVGIQNTQAVTVSFLWFSTASVPLSLLLLLALLAGCGGTLLAQRLRRVSARSRPAPLTTTSPVASTSTPPTPADSIEAPELPARSALPAPHSPGDPSRPDWAAETGRVLGRTFGAAKRRFGSSGRDRR
ncbi:MAG: DUF1049 domain-containing protein [Chloroflexi bacterium]|nr:DUF1049 domain-containing protein [Chloroflexota bacterium]